MNPYRPVPGNAPPTYVAPPQPYTTAPPPVYNLTPPSVPTVVRLPQRQTIAETPVMAPTVPMVAPPMPSVIGPSNPIPQPPVAPAEYRGRISGAKPAETNWRPVSATEPDLAKPAAESNWKQEPEENNGLIIPIIRGAARRSTIRRWPRGFMKPVMAW